MSLLGRFVSRRNGVAADHETERPAFRGRAVSLTKRRAMARGDFENGSLESFGKGCPLFGRDETDFGVYREGSDAFSGIRGELHGAAQFGLQSGSESQKVLRGEGVGDVSGVSGQSSEQLWRKHVSSGGCDIALLKHLAAATASGASEKPGAGKFADVVVDGLSGQVHAAGDAGGGVGFDKGGENLKAKRVIKKCGGLGGVTDQAKRCRCVC